MWSALDYAVHRIIKCTVTVIHWETDLHEGRFGGKGAFSVICAKLDCSFTLLLSIHDEMTMSSSGFIIFMPWVTLPDSVRVGRFRFCPLPVQNVKSVIDPEMVSTIENVLKCYVRKNGKPIESCTIVLRARHQQAWNIPREHWSYANSAAKTLALACLAEQRFFEGHFSPHLNATMFHLIGEGITAGRRELFAFVRPTLLPLLAPRRRPVIDFG
jgi:hypothetical protein